MDPVICITRYEHNKLVYIKVLAFEGIKITSYGHKDMDRKVLIRQHLLALLIQLLCLNRQG